MFINTSVFAEHDEVDGVSANVMYVLVGIFLCISRSLLYVNGVSANAT